jgi:hypothetical protein
MALTLSARREGVSIDGKRTVTYTCAFSNGDAAEITKAVLGLHRVDDVFVTVAASGGTGVDLTAQDSDSITLDPVAAATLDLVFVGY